MEPSKTVSSFIQYQRCSLCRVNHNKGKKHIYSKKHVETLDDVMMKLAAKVSVILASKEKYSSWFTVVK